MTNLQLAASLVASPRRFFGQLAEHPRFALPMIASVLLTVGLLVWFYAVVDVAWLIEQTLNANPRTATMTDAQRAQAARVMTPGLLMWGSLIGGVVFTFVIRLLEAAWYRFAGRATGLARSFRQWFAFAWWTSLPHVMTVIPAAVTLAFGTTGQIDAGALQPLSLNELVFHLPMGAPAHDLLANISLIHLVTLGLSIFGVRCWSARSWLYSSLLTLVPAVLLYGGWALIALRTR